jgi:hypothetical protein
MALAAQTAVATNNWWASTSQADPALPDGRRAESIEFCTWSLKSGGRYVWFSTQLQLDAFAYLSAQPHCVDIVERPFDGGLTKPRLADLNVDIGTLDAQGCEHLYVVHDSDTPDQQTLGQHWLTTQIAAKRSNTHCHRIRSTDLIGHQVLIRNWLDMMDYVREAELDPDFDLQAEIMLRAAHPEGEIFLII